MRQRTTYAIIGFLIQCGCYQDPGYDLVIRHGTVYDGTGAPGAVEDVAIRETV